MTGIIPPTEEVGETTETAALLLPPRRGVMAVNAVTLVKKAVAR
jgi:hypothetical protein